MSLYDVNSLNDGVRGSDGSPAIPVSRRRVLRQLGDLASWQFVLAVC